MITLRVLFLLFFCIELIAANCGLPNDVPNLTGKIVGGVDVGYYKYPWFAALWMQNTVWCGGTLISSNVVLTAAHCFDSHLNDSNYPLETVFTIKMGLYNSCVSESTQREYKVRKVYIHEKYLSTKPYFDIALMKVRGDASQFLPACLPHRALSDSAKGREGIIAGYGTRAAGEDSYPCEMYEGRVLLFPTSTCKEMLQNTAEDPNDVTRFKNAFCAGYKEGGVDTCQGDSGGPLMVQSTNGRYYLIGITSFGYSCAKPKQLGVYTDVSKYLRWIESKMGVESVQIRDPGDPDGFSFMKDISGYASNFFQSLTYWLKNPSTGKQHHTAGTGAQHLGKAHGKTHSKAHGKAHSKAHGKDNKLQQKHKKLIKHGN